MTRTRILIADDHKAMRQIVAKQLEPEFEIVGAVEDGQAFLSAELKTQPDICILDISMPILDGIETALRLRDRKPGVRIIFLTAHEDLDYLNAALETGALGYVIKSRVIPDLAAAVRSARNGLLFVSPFPGV